MPTLRWIALALGACVLTVFLGGTWFHAVPLVSAALAYSVREFGRDERPLVHEAHELGVVWRALVQGVVCGGLYALLELTAWLRADASITKTPLLSIALELELGAFFFLPAYAETRTRVRSPGLGRDARGAVLVFAAALLIEALTWIARDLTYSAASFPGIDVAKTLHDFAEHFSKPAELQALAASAIVFVPPALARLHEARPREVLIAALAGAALASAAKGNTATARGFVDGLMMQVPIAIALALGAAFGDRFVRKIERSLPGHAKTHG